jgi:hypothetical protein
MDKQMDTHIMEYYLATERKEVLIWATTRMNLKNMMSSKRNQTKMATEGMIPFI